jgi:hypothetical protein
MLIERFEHSVFVLTDSPSVTSMNSEAKDNIDHASDDDYETFYQVFQISQASQASELVHSSTDVDGMQIELWRHHDDNISKIWTDVHSKLIVRTDEMIQMYDESAYWSSQGERCYQYCLFSSLDDRRSFLLDRFDEHSVSEVCDLWQCNDFWFSTTGQCISAQPCCDTPVSHEHWEEIACDDASDVCEEMLTDEEDVAFAWK